MARSERGQDGESTRGNPDLPTTLGPAFDHCGLDVVRVIEELEGGASTRRFFRLQLPAKETCIAMYTPEPSQELSRGRAQSDSHGYLAVHDELARRGVRVPRIVGAAPDHCVICLEDLGPDTLARYISRHPEATRELYRQAIADLARTQSRFAESVPSIVAGRSFDHQLLLWELQHFETWALEARGVRPSPIQTRVIQSGFEFVATTIASWPRGYVHRDYQSRNLMVVTGRDARELVWIDFQDSMLGPRTYDLVALLTDSYQSFSRDFTEEMLRYYLERRGHQHQWEALRDEFDLVTVQRKLKDAGRFVFVDQVNGNPAFLRFVDATITRARDALQRLQGQRELRELAEVLSELLDTSVDRSSFG